MHVDLTSSHRSSRVSICVHMAAAPSSPIHFCSPHASTSDILSTSVSDASDCRARAWCPRLFFARGFLIYASRSPHVSPCATIVRLRCARATDALGASSSRRRRVVVVEGDTTHTLSHSHTHTLTHSHSLSHRW